MARNADKMRLLDLFSCAGGAAAGYHDAGFEVVGVDIDPQPHYPFEHHVADALEFVAKHGHEFDAIHASPPCQAFSATKSLHSREHPDLIQPTREALQNTVKPWIMENVPRSPLINPVMLCGTEFDLRANDVDGKPLKLIRHRLFESNMPLHRKDKCRHDRNILTASIYGAGGGWTPKHRDSPGRMGGYVPHTDVCKELLNIRWMNKHELSQSIPPAFTEYLGGQLLEYIAASA